MKRKLTIYIFLIAALSVVISSAVGVWSFHQREVEDARQTLTELLSLMDAEGSTTDVSGLLKQFSQAAPDKRLTLIALTEPCWGILRRTSTKITLTALRWSRPWRMALVKISAVRPAMGSPTSMKLKFSTMV